jgi:hypothetical protein
MTTNPHRCSGLSCAVVAVATLGLSSPVWSSGPQAVCKTYQPFEAMTKELGSKSTLAYFVSKTGACSVVLMISEKYDPDSPATPPSAARVRLALAPSESLIMDSDEGGSLLIQCGPEAALLNVTTGPREEITGLQQNVRWSMCATSAAK